MEKLSFKEIIMYTVGILSTICVFCQGLFLGYGLIYPVVQQWCLDFWIWIFAEDTGLMIRNPQPYLGYVAWIGMVWSGVRFMVFATKMCVRVGLGTYGWYCRVLNYYVTQKFLVLESIVQREKVEGCGTAPSCQMKVQTTGAFNSIIGQCLRISDFIVVPTHVLTSAKSRGSNQIHIVGQTGAIDIDCDRFLEVYTDVSACKLGTNKWARLGARKASVCYDTRGQITITALGETNFGSYRQGKSPNVVFIDANTLAGFSGAAYMQAGQCVGMHIGNIGPEINGGYYLSFLEGLLNVSDSKFLIFEAEGISSENMFDISYDEPDVESIQIEDAILYRNARTGKWVTDEPSRKRTRVKGFRSAGNSDDEDIVLGRSHGSSHGSTQAPKRVQFDLPAPSMTKSYSVPNVSRKRDKGYWETKLDHYYDLSKAINDGAAREGRVLNADERNELGKLQGKIDHAKTEIDKFVVVGERPKLNLTKQKVKDLGEIAEDEYQTRLARITATGVELTQQQLDSLRSLVNQQLGFGGGDVKTAVKEAMAELLEPRFRDYETRFDSIDEAVQDFRNRRDVSNAAPQSLPSLSQTDPSQSPNANSELTRRLQQSLEKTRRQAAEITRIQRAMAQLRSRVPSSTTTNTSSVTGADQSRSTSQG